ncbi:MAG: hydrogenase maturation nickel metallochaperone HypA [Agathobacter sp.]|nr:hydrogenase maturation nickel metallochaperone HypA [Agathobacter sp.]
MHELGVVFHVVKMVKEVAADNELTKIESVTLSVGEVSTIIESYLQSCWQWTMNKEEEILHDAKLKVEIIKGITYCENCNQQYETVTYGKICPYCKSDMTYLVQGNEFKIKEIEGY